MQNFQTCLRLTDSSQNFLSTKFLFAGKDPRDLQKETIIARKFVEQNSSYFFRYGVNADVINDGRTVKIQMDSHDQIGACPLKSPLSGQFDYGMIIEPRFRWEGLGTMLDSMGWKIIPELQKLPMLPRSSREIPTWVISSVIILRLDALLRNISRRFEPSKEYLSMPRGRIDWKEYATRQFPQMKMLEIPCEFSSLNDHLDLLGAIHFTLKKLIAELSSQRTGGTIVIHLIQHAQKLLQKVSIYLPVRPSSKLLRQWFYGSIMNHQAVADGLEAMQWSLENRGLAGLSDFRGLPWKMSMSAFFEAWVETLAQGMVTKIGGTVLAGRKNETVVPIAWEKASLGTQKSLRPDVVIQREDEIIIIDAKFKTHWAELNQHSWMNMDIEHQAEHRNDLLQVLAYSTCFSEEHLKVCLVYPCWQNVWEDLAKHNQLHRKASLYSGTRHIELLLTAVPMSGKVNEITQELVKGVA